MRLRLVPRLTSPLFPDRAIRLAPGCGAARLRVPHGGKVVLSHRARRDAPLRITIEVSGGYGCDSSVGLYSRSVPTGIDCPNDLGVWRSPVARPARREGRAITSSETRRTTSNCD